MNAPAKASWKLTDRERREMARAWFAGASREFLAIRYGVHPRYVTKAAHRMGLRKRSAA
jgi:hypothetical protein